MEILYFTIFRRFLTKKQWVKPTVFNVSADDRNHFDKNDFTRDCILLTTVLTTPIKCIFLDTICWNTVIIRHFAQVSEITNYTSYIEKMIV